MTKTSTKKLPEIQPPPSIRLHDVLGHFDAVLDQVLILRAKEITERNGVQIASMARAQRRFGLVLGVGPKVEHPRIAPGAIVVFDEASANAFLEEGPVDQHSTCVACEDQVFAVFKDFGHLAMVGVANVQFPEWSEVIDRLGLSIA